MEIDGMTGTKPPEDIEAKAQEVARDIDYDAIDVSGNMFYDQAVPIIAAALLAERERCAKIAEEWPLVERLLPMADESHNEAALTGQHEAAERIAAAIRKGTQ